jgi:hypothetical protein
MNEGPLLLTACQCTAAPRRYRVSSRAYHRHNRELARALWHRAPHACAMTQCPIFVPKLSPSRALASLTIVIWPASRQPTTYYVMYAKYIVYRANIVLWLSMYGYGICICMCMCMYLYVLSIKMVITCVPRVTWVEPSCSITCAGKKKIKC